MRKYMTEFLLDIVIKKFALLGVEGIYNIEEEECIKDYHIYSVLLKRKYFLDTTSIVKTKKSISFTVFYMLDGAKKNIKIKDFTIKTELNHKKIDITSVFPHEKALLTISDTDFLRKIDFPKEFELMDNLLMIALYLQYPEVNEYKILYIGQSYGKSGEKNAVDRLSNHEVLQEVLSKANTDFREYNICLLLLKVEKTTPTFTVDGLSKEYSKTDSEDNEHIEKVLSAESDTKQIINITEAALINYFKPQFNQKFKENFPSKKHTSYADYFDLDYHSIRISLNRDLDFGGYLRIYTDCVRHFHKRDFIEYKLNNDPSRSSMYGIFKE